MFDCWWGIGNTRCSGGEERTREEQEDGGGIAVVEGIDEGGEEVVKPMAGMTYLRNQVYVGRRSIVPVHSRVGLPSVIAATFCRPYLSLRLPANTTLRTCTTNPHEFLS